MADTKIDIFMPLYIGDYLADTTDLDAEEHGAYMLLMMAAWRRGGRLPLDKDRLAHIARVRPDRWPGVWETISRYFTEDGNALVQKRLSRELAKAQGFRENASKAGQASVAARREKHGSAQPLRGAPEQDAEQPPNGAPNGSPNGTSNDSRRSTFTVTSTSTFRGTADSAALWDGLRWLALYKAAFFDAKGRMYGRGSADAKAVGDLGDILAELSEPARRAAQGAAQQLFAKYFARDGKTASNGWPFTWFVTDFNAMCLELMPVRRPALRSVPDLAPVPKLPRATARPGAEPPAEGPTAPTAASGGTKTPQGAT